MLSDISFQDCFGKRKAMKRKNSTAALICIAFFVLFSIFRIDLSKVSNVNTNLIAEIITTAKESKPMDQNTRVEVQQGSSKPPPPLQTSQSKPIISCDRSHGTYDLCSVNVPTVLDPTVSTFYAMDPPKLTQLQEKIQPYGRKWEKFTMSRIKEVTLTSGPVGPKCDVQHSVPALVYSAGGYTGNFFHEFNDGFIPLFITVNTIFPDGQDFVLVISKARGWWISKYRELLHTFSPYPIIDLDNDNVTHCFPSAHVGLVSHGFMTIDPKLIPNRKTFIHFRGFLDKAYGHGSGKTSTAINRKARPRLILATRSGGVGRVVLNQNEVVRVMKEEGFDVIVFEPRVSTPLHEAYALVNSSHAMVGVHGAALTHSLFLRPGSTFLQIVPLGDEWVAKVCFGDSARAMGLNYTEYYIKAEESSLIDKYGKDNVIVKDPKAFKGEGWSHEAMTIYLKEQDVKLDLKRFRGHLKEMYKQAKNFHEKEG